ncbi:C40 family peptidase [Cohnella nanjingensis]|uniref:C40 family peptidase n=1 Tax=Cohnella nanjingensis TaxID=1387779 RepID=A0A7X0RRS2_9BACL|nr:C40 family peptidase [Cohnella nanjingensis]MBB6672350.1 C40 family peptidase [Cohnella nanjingensis]
MHKRMQFTKRGAGLLVAALVAASLAGCAFNPSPKDLRKYSGPDKVRSLAETRANERTATSVVPVKTIHHSNYVSLSDVARAADLHGAWLSDGSYGIGDHDPVWKFRKGDSAVTKSGKTIRMQAPAVQDSNRLYIPVSGMRALFGSEVAINSHGDTISFLPKSLPAESGATGRGLPFRDAASPAENGNRLHIASAGAAQADSILQEARKYMGVKYDFGAGNYADTGTFDCSSFTQFLFAKVGIHLPRTAREQANEGRSVARSDLEKGDLLFFYVPGRFKTDTTVGHVGIYMGGGKMIHSSPKPEDGVQITNINSAYWQETFLYAKRLLS